MVETLIHSKTSLDLDLPQSEIHTYAKLIRFIFIRVSNMICVLICLALDQSSHKDILKQTLN